MTPTLARPCMTLTTVPHPHTHPRALNACRHQRDLWKYARRITKRSSRSHRRRRESVDVGPATTDSVVIAAVGDAADASAVVASDPRAGVVVGPDHVYVYRDAFHALECVRRGVALAMTRASVRLQVRWHGGGCDTCAAKHPKRVHVRTSTWVDVCALHLPALLGCVPVPLRATGACWHSLPSHRWHCHCYHILTTVPHHSLLSPLRLLAACTSVYSAGVVPRRG